MGNRSGRRQLDGQQVRGQEIRWATGQGEGNLMGNRSGGRKLDGQQIRGQEIRWTTDQGAGN